MEATTPNMTQVQENILPTRHQPTDMLCLDDILNIDDEIRQWEEKLETEPENDKILARLSELYKEQSNPNKSNHLKKAKKYALKALRINPENFTALTNLGFAVYFAENDSGDNILKTYRLLERMLGIANKKEISDEDAVKIANLASLLGKTDILTKYSETALEKNPDNVDALVLQASQQMTLPVRKQLLKRSLAVNPLHEAGNLHLANVYGHTITHDTFNAFDYYCKLVEKITRKRGTSLRKEPIYGSVGRTRFELEDIHPFVPEEDAHFVHIFTDDDAEYFMSMITMRYLEILFEKNKRTGECNAGTYFCMPYLSIIRRLDTARVRQHLKKIIDLFGINKVSDTGIIRKIEEDIEDSPTQTKASQQEARKAYEEKYAGLVIDTYYPKDFNPKNGRAIVNITLKDGTRYASNFVSLMYLKQYLDTPNQIDRTIFNKEEMVISDSGISIPYMVILEEVNDETVKKTIGGMLEGYNLKSNFKLL